MKIYLAGPMTGIPSFNFPAFDVAAARLRRQLGVFVFSPAEHDRCVYGPELEDNPTGDPILAKINHGFSLRKALLDDLTFICNEADGIALLPGWENSKGVTAELSLAKALGLSVFELGREFVE